MATAQRTYIVSSKAGDRLVVATNQSQAIRHVVSQEYKARSADGMEVATLMERGIKLERASSSPETKDMFGEEQGA